MSASIVGFRITSLITSLERSLGMESRFPHLSWIRVIARSIVFPYSWISLQDYSLYYLFHRVASSFCNLTSLDLHYLDFSILMDESMFITWKSTNSQTQSMKTILYLLYIYQRWSCSLFVGQPLMYILFVWLFSWLYIERLIAHASS